MRRSIVDSHRVLASKENFAIWCLTGMKNTTKKIVEPLVGKTSSRWFLSCIQMMIDEIKNEQDKRRIKKSS